MKTFGIIVAANAGLVAGLKMKRPVLLSYFQDKKSPCITALKKEMAAIVERCELFQEPTCLYAFQRQHDWQEDWKKLQPLVLEFSDLLRSDDPRFTALKTLVNACDSKLAPENKDSLASIGAEWERTVADENMISGKVTSKTLKTSAALKLEGVLKKYFQLSKDMKRINANMSAIEKNHVELQFARMAKTFGDAEIGLDNM